MKSFAEYIAEAKTAINVELKQSGSTYKAVVSGNVGAIEVEGESTQYLHGIDELSSTLVRSILLNKIHRADGLGKSVPMGAIRKIEAAVLAKLQSI
jgi:hypothetical protein